MSLVILKKVQGEGLLTEMLFLKIVTITGLSLQIYLSLPHTIPGKTKIVC